MAKAAANLFTALHTAWYVIGLFFFFLVAFLLANTGPSLEIVNLSWKVQEPCLFAPCD